MNCLSFAIGVNYLSTFWMERIVSRSARRELSLVCVHRLIELSRSVWRELSIVHGLTENYLSFITGEIYLSFTVRENCLSSLWSERIVSCPYSQRELSLVLVSCSQSERIIPR